MEYKGFLLASLLVLSLVANALALDHLSASVYGSVNFGSPSSTTPAGCPPPTNTSKSSPSSYNSSPPPPKTTPSPSPASPPPPKTPKPSPPPPTPKPSSPSPASPPPPAPKPSSPAPQTPKPSPPPPPTYYGPEKPKHDKSKHDKPKKSKDDDKLPSINMGVEGLIMCKNGSKAIPIEGAVARITCLAINLLGFETAPFSCLSRPTDKMGYFFATISGDQLDGVLKIIECKAFLENSPIKTCKVPTDINNGISGFPLNIFKILSHNHLKLYSAKPLYYAPVPLKSAPATPGGY